ncbi:tetratricopeptide repeat protein [Edaphobacter sp. HDX4]|uniref:tetratricopeptide repeat protein n=1 Tax=Edaphobacter sp. HDX4 TaxID=2794064 RepID=UPI002FE65717
MIHYRQIVGAGQILACVLAYGQSTPLQLGILSLERGDYPAALRELKEASHGRPNDASIHNFIGITETKLGDIDDADREYQAASRLDPTLSGPYKNLGFNYLNAGQYELAEAPLKTALSLDHRDPFIHYYLAILYLSTSRITEAILQISPAQDLLGKDASNALLAIKTCLQSGHPDEALNLIHLLSRGSLLSFAQVYEVANLLTEHWMYVDAVPLFEELVQRQPGSWENKYNLASAFLKAKRPKDARMLLVPLSLEHKGDANILSMLGSAYDLEGKPALALEPYRNAIDLDHSNPNRYLDCTRVMVDLNRFDEASALLRRGLALVPDPYVLRIRIGAIEMMQGHYEKARESFKEALLEHPDIALGYVALAQTYMKEADNQTAMSILMDGRNKVSKDFALEYVLGLVSFEVGEQEQALEALTNAEQLGPDVVEPHYQLGMLYMQRHQWIDAQDEFNRVLRINPHHATSFYQLSRTYERTGDVDKARQMAAQASSLNRTQREDAIRFEQLRLGIPSNPDQP